MPTFAWIIPLLKRHWKPLLCILLVGLLLYSYLFIERGWTKQVKKLQEIHQKEIKDITVAHETERRELEENARQLESRLQEIQQRYSEQQLLLQRARHREVVRIVTQYKADPRGLTREFGNVMGFQVKEGP